MKSELFWIILAIGISIALINGCSEYNPPMKFIGKDAEKEFGPRPYLWSDGKELHFRFFAKNDGILYRSGTGIFTGNTKENLITVRLDNIVIPPGGKILEGKTVFDESIDSRSVNLCLATFETTEGYASTIPPMEFKIEREKLVIRPVVAKDYPLTIERSLKIEGKSVLWELSLHSSYPSKVTVDLHIILLDDVTQEKHEEVRTVEVFPSKTTKARGKIEFSKEIMSVTLNAETTATHLAPIEK